MIKNDEINLIYIVFRSFINEDELEFKLTPIINKLIVSDVYRTSLSKKIKSISKKDAVKTIINEIEYFLK